MAKVQVITGELADEIEALFKSKQDALKGTDKVAIQDAQRELGYLKAGMELPEALPAPKREGWASHAVGEALFGEEKTEDPFHRAVRVIDEVFLVLDKVARPKFPSRNHASLMAVQGLHKQFKTAIKDAAITHGFELGFASDKQTFLAY